MPMTASKTSVIFKSKTHHCQSSSTHIYRTTFNRVTNNKSILQSVINFCPKLIYYTLEPMRTN